MKIPRLPHLRRRATATASVEISFEHVERPRHQSLDELLLPYSRGDEGADLQDDPSGELGAAELHVEETLADQRPLAEEAVEDDAEPAELVEDEDPSHHDAWSQVVGDVWGDEDAWAPVAEEDDEPVLADDVAEPLVEDGGEPALEEDADEPALEEEADEPAFERPAEVYELPLEGAPVAGWQGLEEAVRLAALDHAELLAEAGRRRIEGRRAMDRDELIAALLADGDAGLRAA